MGKLIITFNSSRAAIKADGFCSQQNIACEVTATPTDISSECGISLLVDAPISLELEDYLKSINITYQIYDRFTKI